MSFREVIKAYEGVYKNYSHIKYKRSKEIVVKCHTAKNMYMLKYDLNYNPITAYTNFDGIRETIPYDKNGNFEAVENLISHIIVKRISRKEMF